MNLEDLVQADPQAVAVEVRVLASLAGLGGGQGPGLAGWPAGRRRRWRRRGVLLVAQVLILQHVVRVLALQVAWDWRDDGAVGGDANQQGGRKGCVCVYVCVGGGMRASSYPTMAAVGLVLCCGCVEPLVDSVTSLPPFSQSKGSFSVMIRSFMLFSNTDISSWTETQGATYWALGGVGPGGEH